MYREIRAQALLLESVLTHRPLPGMNQVRSLPSLKTGDEDIQIILVVDDPSSTELSFPSEARTVTKDELESLGPRNQLQVLEFQPSDSNPGEISVRLWLSVDMPGHGFVKIEEIVATFHDRDPLTATKLPYVFA